MQVDVEQAQADLPKLIEEAMSGSEVIITRNRQPLVRLIEAERPTSRGRRPGSAKGLITIADDFDEPLEDFRDYT
jgi:antitoxin (DNA-binding transcriptional repressor) of toxin-antitoxin stability system